jgi:hypothetical protein
MPLGTDKDFQFGIIPLLPVDFIYGADRRILPLALVCNECLSKPSFLTTIAKQVIFVL